ncbi:hypothetical protein [uncultured Fusobacterium sp.]|jgi:hypothetical protein|uniref:hypothetical protein n=1 Tax=uncultured Fusobacterium sp. TaxID=159267 RepID=UPI0027DAC0E5|nr:hypothetical protein [uncultured Fusobacterium sp.]
MEKLVLEEILKCNFIPSQMKEKIGKYQIIVDLTETFTEKFGWNTTWAYVNIICDSQDEDVIDILNKNKSQIEKVLRDNIYFGKNLHEESYIPLVKVKKILKETENKL